jgi:hypothetical protein
LMSGGGAVTRLPAIYLSAVNVNRASCHESPRENIVTTGETCGQYKIALPQFADRVVEYIRHWVRSVGG